jgi:hypothetical protein
MSDFLPGHPAYDERDFIARENDRQALAFIHQFFMGDKGTYFARTSPKTWEAVYAMGDGFGKRTREELRDINDGFDWSHIRDSSWQALQEMERALIEWCQATDTPLGYDRDWYLAHGLALK